MSALQELNRREISEVILSAAEHNLPLSITVRDGNHWANLQSRLAGLKDQCLLLDIPVSSQGHSFDFSPGQSIGVGLKLKHHKYLFLSNVAPQDPSAGQDGGEGFLVLSRPTRMQRLQRRAYVRAAVPSGCVTRAAFWVGGRMNEPAGTSPDRPVWSGRVMDLSAGGFSVRTSEESAGLLEAGYLVGTRLLFGAGQEAVYADACVRHIALDDNGKGAVVGFQFLGLEYSDDAKQALRSISQKVSEYHAAESHRQALAADEASLAPAPLAAQAPPAIRLESPDSQL